MKNKPKHLFFILVFISFKRGKNLKRIELASRTSLNKIK